MPSYSDQTVLAMAAATNGLLAAAKLIVAGRYGMTVVLAEAIHSLAAMSSQLLLWLTIREAPLAQRRGSVRHPHSAMAFWGHIAAAMIYALAAGAVLAAATFHSMPQPASGGGAAAGLTLAGALLLLAALAAVVHRARQEPPVGAQAERDPLQRILALESGAGGVGLALALAGLAGSHALGRGWPASAASALIGLVMGYVAASMANAARRHLQDRDRLAALPRDPPAPAEPSGAEPAVHGAQQALPDAGPRMGSSHGAAQSQSAEPAGKRHDALSAEPPRHNHPPRSTRSPKKKKKRR